MCGASFENIIGSLFDSLFVCLFFFLQRELFLVFGALEPSNFISQNTVINDKMTSIDQKIVYETLSTGIFFLLLPCVSEPEVSEQGSSLNLHRDKNFQFLPTMHLDFSYHNKRRFFITSPCTPIAFIYRTPINGLFGCMKFVEVS